MLKMIILMDKYKALSKLDIVITSCNIYQCVSKSLIFFMLSAFFPSSP